MDYAEKTAGLCVFNVKDDPLIKAFGLLGKGTAQESAQAYSAVCCELLMSGKTLGEYLHDMIVYSDSPLAAKTAAEPTPLRLAAAQHDIAVIAQLARTDSAALRQELSARYDEGFMNLPAFETGEFDYAAEYFLDFVRTHGNGIFAAYKAFTYTNGALMPVEQLDPIRLSDLKNYEAQRSQVVENTLCFLSGKPAQNVLLYGDRGTGKSSTVKAILNEYEALRMVELSKNDVAWLPALFRTLKDIPLRFIVTIDDLSFAENDDRFSILKAALEGSLAARPENILIYATTNRRKIIRETVADREINGADAIDESLSLADRFGLTVTFTKPNREVYLDIAAQLAADRGVTLPEEELNAAAERFALKRGGRSPRTARQFADWLCGRIELGLDY